MLPSGSLSERDRLLLELGAARERVTALERRIAELGDLPGGDVGAASDEVPGRLRAVLEAFDGASGPRTLDEVFQFVKKAERRAITRAGVRNRIIKLVELGYVRQVDRGLFERVPA